MGAPRVQRLVSVAPALLVVAPASLSLWRALVCASWWSLGRDQGIFQYVAWAVDQGEVLYRDVRDVNGPVVTMVHLALHRLGGADEHRFRVLDLVVSGLVFALAGACVPSVVRARARLEARVAWAVAAWAALSAQYVAYGFWDTAQRESFLDWFVLGSIALQATHVASADPRSRRAALALAGAGAASLVPWLGKPTFALFTASQLVALLVEEEPLRARVRRVALFVAGGLAGAAGPLAFLALRGDLRAWARITFVDVPAMYRFIWPRSAGGIFALPGYSAVVLLALATTAGLLVLVARGRIARRAIPIATMPAVGLASVVAQAKGFPYHFHPVTLGIALGWLVALAAVWEGARSAVRRGAVLAAALAVGVRAALLSASAAYPPAPPAGARDRASLESAARLAAFERVDFSPRALRDAAEYVAARTSPDDRVQTYGMDPYVLFLARRRSATPYVYAYDLDVDAALRGSFEPDGPRPTAEQAERIVAMRMEHARDLLVRLERSPPAAFLFVDRSPLMTHESAFADLSSHCPEVTAWLSAHYREAASFDVVHVWTREDGAERDRDGGLDAPRTWR